MALTKFTKPSGFLRSTKRTFFEDNAKHLAETRRVAEIYTAQPKRIFCKCCDKPLEGESFEKGGIRYIFCMICGHLNGAHDDTPEFCEAVYGSEAMVETYAGDIPAYQKRVDDIYLPKAKHLLESLRELGESGGQFSIFDIGTGGGHFIQALRQLGISKISGCEISKGLCKLANERLDANLVVEECSEKMLANVDVVSMIHTLEHLPDPRGMMERIRYCERVRWLYIAIPMFSASVYFETAFSDAFPRHLSGGHTHLFTTRSLDYFCKEWGLNRRTEWWFGTDMMDLFRMVGLAQNGTLAKRWGDEFAELVDPWQTNIDFRRMSSEIHFLAQIIR